MKINEVTDTSPQEIYSSYKEQIDHMITRDTYIFRGIKSEEPVLLLNSQDKLRNSSGSYDWYMQVMKDDPDWKNYPDRSYSFICSTSMEEARSYGKVYSVIPLDKNQVFGIAPDADFWYAFPELKKIKLSIAGIQSIYERIFFQYKKYYQDDLPRISDVPNNEIKKAFALYDEAIKKTPTVMNHVIGHPHILRNIEQKGLYKTMEDEIKPVGFHSTTLNGINKYKKEESGGGSEIWFSGPALFLEQSVFHQIRKLANEDI